MSRRESIKFTIRQDGTVIETVEGVYGAECENLTRNIEEKLGEVYFREPTADQFQVVPIDLEQNVTFNQN